MASKGGSTRVDRRSFLKTSTVAAGAALIGAGAARPKAAQAADGLDHRNERPDRMQYRKLGRTNLNCSALVFGCGAALRDPRAVRLLDRAFDQGVNHYDVGRTYKGSEEALAPFMKRHREEIWVTSKAPTRVSESLGLNEEVTVDIAKGAARYWAQQLDLSLKALDTDYVDAYYLMGMYNPGIVRCEEVGKAFEAARDAGKVGHFGISTHQQAQHCLEAAIETGWYSQAMIAITPSGWYDNRGRGLLTDLPDLKGLRPVLDRARAAGIGLVGMKAARHIAVNPYGGGLGKAGEQDESVTKAFDKHYSDKFMKTALSPYQRSYTYVLENGLDVVNSDMQNFKHFEENLVAARDSATLYA